MSEPIVVYLGPSVLDGAPIVAIATVGSTNIKTGPMVQTWIMRADVNPLQASADKLDSSVCGDCPRRHSLGGDCYVTLVQAPRAVWANWDKHGRPGENWADERNVLALQQGAQAHGLRLGSYGDPASVPWTVWADLMDALQPRIHTGYTHQWHGLSHPVSPDEASWLQGRWCRDNLMASCDSIEETIEARGLGWRTFTATRPHEVPVFAGHSRTILCLADREGDKARTCEQCGICNGAQGRPQRTSVYLVEHGGRSTAKHKRSAALAVLP